MTDFPSTQEMIEKICANIRLLDDNSAAHYSQVTHAIFDDYNLGTGASLYEAATDHAGWKIYIDDKYADLVRERRPDIGGDFALLLGDVTDTIDVLLALCLFSDGDLAAAEDYLHANGLPRL